MRKKGIPVILVASLMSLYEGARTRVRVDSEFSHKLNKRELRKLITPKIAILCNFVEKQFCYFFIYDGCNMSES